MILTENSINHAHFIYQDGNSNGSGTNIMTKKVVDLMAYKIEKTLKESGFTLKHDGNRKVKLLMKVAADENKS